MKSFQFSTDWLTFWATIYTKYWPINFIFFFSYKQYGKNTWLVWNDIIMNTLREQVYQIIISWELPKNLVLWNLLEKKFVRKFTLLIESMRFECCFSFCLIYYLLTEKKRTYCMFTMQPNLKILILVIIALSINPWEKNLKN